MTPHICTKISLLPSFLSSSHNSPRLGRILPFPYSRFWFVLILVLASPSSVDSEYLGKTFIACTFLFNTV